MQESDNNMDSFCDMETREIKGYAFSDPYFYKLTENVN